MSDQQRLDPEHDSLADHLEGPCVGSLAWLAMPLELGTATFPRLVKTAPTPRVAVELEDDGGHLFGSSLGERPGEGAWCE